MWVRVCVVGLKGGRARKSRHARVVVDGNVEGVSCLHDLLAAVGAGVGGGVRRVRVRVRACAVCVDVDVDVCVGVCFYAWYWGRRRWGGPTGKGRQVVQCSRTTQVAVVGQPLCVVGGGWWACVCVRARACVCAGWQCSKPTRVARVVVVGGGGTDAVRLW